MERMIRLKRFAERVAPAQSSAKTQKERPFCAATQLRSARHGMVRRVIIFMQQIDTVYRVVDSYAVRMHALLDDSTT